ncbi:hypothetical protein DIPPA_11666 [Diplonema papillatum]|nr:hypothetical protein DIPPA_11666 [Diplonema papillatum]
MPAEGLDLGELAVKRASLSEGDVLAAEWRSRAFLTVDADDSGLLAFKELISYQSDLALLVNGCGAQVEQLLSELQRVEAMLEKAQTVSLVEKEKRKAMVDDLQAARMETEDLKDGLAGVAATCRDRLEEATARILGVGEAVPKARGTADTIAQLLQATQQHLIAVLAPLLSAASPAKQQQQHGPPAPSTRHGKGSSSFHSIQPDAREDFEPQPITVPKPRKKSKQPKEKRRKPS